MWIKNQQLVNSNGFFAIKAKQVINAGAQHLKEANLQAGINQEGDHLVNVDKQRQDGLVRNQLVIISKGPLKGYKGSVVFANESMAEVHVHSRC